MSVVGKSSKINVNTFRLMKEKSEKIVCLTAYDYTSARLLDEAGVEMVLVGDSLGMVVNAYETTLPVTLDEMIYHAKSVRRGVKNAFIIVDMPFGSYQVSEEKAVENAVRIMKETGANAVKLEGGCEVAPIVKKITQAGICVMGHIGLEPQSVNATGGYRVFGRDGFQDLLEDAVALESAGAFSVTLEMVEASAAQKISEKLHIPTIGIGSGVGCDGQVLVYHDVFGFFTDFKPKFVKRYLNGAELIKEAAKKFIDDVKSNRFPDDEHSFS